LGLIPDEIVHRIRDGADIVDLVARHVSLKRSGRSHKGLCPFHDEKTPSFHVNPERGTYYCFGCHEGGDAISFLMKVENLTFPEALRALARERGIEIPETRSGPPGQTERLYAAVEAAQARYRRALAAAGNPAAAYLERRGLDGDAIERFGIGFAPDRWDTLATALRDAGIPAEVGERAGLLAPRQSGGFYDRLRGRVTFPIRDVQGRVVAFGGRALGADQEPKYLNTPESPIFRKREAFYGFPQALEPIRRRDRAVVVEGYFDQIALHRAGVPETLATCGTALTPEHARNLARRTAYAVLLFDGDEAGRRAMARALEVLLPQGLRVRAAKLPAGEDPDDFLARRGPEALRRLVDEAPPALDVVCDAAIERGCRTPWEKADAVAAVAPLLALVADPAERGAHCERLALAVGLEVGHVDAAVRAAARGDDPHEPLPVAPRRDGAEERQLRLLAKVLVDDPSRAAGLDPDAFRALAGEHPLARLVCALAAAVRGGAEPRSAHDGLEAEPQQLFLRLSVEEIPYDAGRVPEIIEATLARMRRRRLARERSATTQRLRQAGADAPALIQEKQRQLEERRLTEVSTTS